MAKDLSSGSEDSLEFSTNSRQSKPRKCTRSSKSEPNVLKPELSWPAFSNVTEELPEVVSTSDQVGLTSDTKNDKRRLLPNGLMKQVWRKFRNSKYESVGIQLALERKQDSCCLDKDTLRSKETDDPGELNSLIVTSAANGCASQNGDIGKRHKLSRFSKWLKLTIVKR